MSEGNRQRADQEHRPDQVLGHEFDGIQEYDNRLPNWWLFILYGTVIFSVGYWLFFHTFGIGKLPVQRYQSEMVKATEAQLARMAEGDLNDEALLLMSALADRVQKGRQLYGQYCTVCHLPDGSGSVGPNLTDDHWIHGNRPLDIHAVVTDGVPAKGMAAWGRQLGPRRVESVVAYLLADVVGKHRPGKAPEGRDYGGQASGENAP